MVKSFNDSDPYGGLTDAEKAELRRTDPKTVRLGRYPFRASIKYYCAFQEGNLGPKTLEVDRRKLVQFSGVFEDLKMNKRIVSTDPRQFIQAHISEFMIWMKKKNLNLSTQEKYLQILDRLLQLFGNDVVRVMRRDPLVHLPKGNRDKPIRALSIEEVQKIFDASTKVRGYTGIVLRGTIALLFGTAIRPKESKDALVEDIDLNGKMFFVRHPKGEGSWAEPQWTPIIRGDMVQKLQAFLVERKAFLDKKGIQSEYLFVNPSTMQPFADYSLRRMKQRLEKLSGVSFQLKDFRSTVATLLVEGDLSNLPAVSLLLRHKSVDTTSTYYTRINRTKEIKDALDELWKNKSIK